MADKTEEIEIRLLLEALFQKYHFDFRGYAMASLKRRLKRARDASGVCDHLRHAGPIAARFCDAAEARRVPDGPGQRDVSRSRPISATIRERVVPHLRTYPSLKVWVAGCSAGEELYSFVILFREEGLENRTLFYATDINQDALDQSRDWRLRASTASNCSPRTIASQAESRLCRTITPRRMAVLPSAGAFASALYFPITAW